MGVFEDHAPQYAMQGLTVFPVGGGDGKLPLVKGWNKSGQHKLDHYCRNFPDSNIGFIDGELITRVDIDDKNLRKFAQKHFGDTPV
ncbi:MAG: hypothetical protein VW802_15595, partial [Rhodospirillaceae bacterium]